MHRNERHRPPHRAACLGSGAASSSRRPDHAWQAFLTKKFLEALHRLAIVAVTNVEGTLTYVNDEFCRISKYSYRELIGRDSRILNSGIHSPEFFNEMYRTVAGGGIWRGDVRNRAKDDSLYWVDMTIIPVLGRSGKLDCYISVCIDITKRVCVTESLRSTGDFLEAIIEHAPAVIYVKQASDLTYLLINDAAERYYGKSREAMIGRTAHDVFEKSSAELITLLDREVLKSRVEQYESEHEIETPGNGRRIVTVRRLPILDAMGEVRYLVGVIEDVTERRVAEDKIAYLAYHDALTGLGNRTAFSECVTSAIRQAESSAGSFAILYIDIDRLKEANDVHGHQAGDAILCAVSQRLREVAEGCFVARLGGDEFSIVVSREVTPESLSVLCDNIHASMAQDFRVAGMRCEVELSIGVAAFPCDGTDAHSLMIHADAALYRAKADGRGVTRFFEPTMDLQLRERHAMQRDLRQALAQNELRLYYQPQTEIDGKVVGFEALVRWQHPKRGLVLPNAFIPLAEETGLIVAIGTWVLEEACREAASWQQPLYIAVNVSAQQFKQGDLAELVRTILLRTGLPANRLELEITESILLTDSTATLLMLHRLKALGVSITMDDFGTGYSSLSYLQSFPFSKIKIDQSFVSNLGRNDNAAAIVRAVIGLGRSLELPVIAEGVESEEQLNFLAKELCDQVQGYLLGLPLPIAEYSRVVGTMPAALSA